MPTLDEHVSSEYTKIIYIGDSGTGKTGSLVSLLLAGYKLKILDMDNGLDALVQFAKKEGADLKQVEYATFRDNYRATPQGPMIKGVPKAFTGALTQLTEWSTIEDPMSITVLDTLTSFGKAAFAWARGMNPTAKDPRQWYGTSQAAVEDTLAMLTGPDYKQNVIVSSHVNYKELVEGVNKGHVSSIGTALGPKIPMYFNSMVLAEASGSGRNVRRKIKTLPTGVIDLKMANPKVEAELPLETGLATIFAQLREI
jgi:hypothetical protein